MGRGGHRIGAGRKPGSPGNVGRVLSIQRQKTPSVPAVKVETGPLLEPPTDLEASAQGVWRTYAGYAVGEKTLTEATAAGFREFCQQWVYLHELDKTIQRLGAGTK